MCQARGGGGVLPMWWVIHMCRGFDPLFSLWQDRARSFWGTFSHPPTAKLSQFCGTKTTNFYKNRSFWPQIQFFPRPFWVQFSAASGTPPSVFRPSTPPPPRGAKQAVGIRNLGHKNLTIHTASLSWQFKERKQFYWIWITIKKSLRVMGIASTFIHDLEWHQNQISFQLLWSADMVSFSSYPR